MFPDHREFLPVKNIPSFSITEIVDIFNLLSKSNWEIPYSIKRDFRKMEEIIQERIDRRFSELIEFIEDAKKGNQNIVKAKETYQLGGRSSDIGSYKYLRFKIWENFPEKTDDFYRDINVVENSVLRFISPQVREKLESDSDIASCSESDLEFTRQFLESAGRTIWMDIAYSSLKENEE